MVTALVDLISVREKLIDTKKLSRWTKKKGNSNASIQMEEDGSITVVADEISLEPGTYSHQS